jgi:hypothetical protein
MISCRHNGSVSMKIKERIQKMILRMIRNLKFPLFLRDCRSNMPKEIRSNNLGTYPIYIQFSIASRGISLTLIS